MALTPNPKVSIIVPNYNHARFLRRRMESVLKQTLQDFELILLDDCSTDDSRSLLSEYAGDPRVRIEFNATNSGSPFKQWNKGVGLARGEYIWIAESDDYADERFLETLIAHLDAEPSAGLAYCRSWSIGIDDRPDGLVEHFGDQELDRWTADYCADGFSECANYLVHRNTVPNASAVVLRKAVYEAVGGADESLHLCGDWKLWAAMALRGKILYVATPLNYYRFQETSVRAVSNRRGTVYPETARIRSWILDQVTPLEVKTNDPRIDQSLANAYMRLAFESYPTFPEISRAALQRVRKLGGATVIPRYGTWKVQLLERIIGWKATKRIHAFYASVLSKERFASCGPSSEGASGTM